MYQPGCGFADDYCGTPWRAIAKKEETTAPLECGVTPGGVGAGVLLPFAVWLAALLVWRRRSL